MPYENFLVNEPKRLKSRRVKKAFRPSSRKMRSNFLGEELMILGNPRRRKRKKSFLSSFLGNPKSSILKRKRRKISTKGGVKMAKKRRRKAVRSNAPARRRRRHTAVRRNEPKRRRRYAMRRNAPKRRRRYAMRRNAPARRHRRSYRNNAPAIMGGAVSITKPQTLLPYFLTGAASAIITAKVPSLIGAGDSPLWRYGSQALTAIGGGWLVSRFIGRQHGFVWAAVGGSIIVADLLSKYVLTQVGISGLGEDLSETSGYPYAEVGYYPYSEMEGYPYAEVGAYPYEYA